MDTIPAEMWKYGGLKEELIAICEKAYHGDVPDIWRKGGILPLLKKEYLCLTTNYRVIRLSAVAATIYNKMLLNRLRPHIDLKLRINLNGFRQNRSIVLQILVLQKVLEGIKPKNIPAVMTFIDFKKAFNSIQSGKLMEILAGYGVPSIAVAAINGLYTSTEAKVLSPDRDTDSFEIIADVLQGDTLAPYLFVIALDYAIRIAIVNEEDLGLTLSKAKCGRYPAIYISDTDFADVIALLSNPTIITKARNNNKTNRSTHKR